MKNLLAMTLSSALLSAPLLAVSTSTQAGETEASVYWQGSGFLRDSDGNCVRTSDWHPDSQIKGCDLIKEKTMPKPVVAIRIDTDKDGIEDATDQCPNTPSGAAVNNLGCEPDSDKDGIVDARDMCANTPSGVRVDSKGCERDSDNDSIADSRDQCAGTPVGAKVDLNGCIVELMEPINYDLRVQFASNSSKISGQYDADFKKVADLLKRDSGVRVVINGYTDDRGDIQYNRGLSQRRAERVVQRLVNEYGIAPNRLSALGHGPASPIADNRTKAGRAINRRVEASVKVIVAKS